jgi:signal transduction histidine kinase
MTLPSAWSTQQLAEFVAVVSLFDTESSAGLGAVERIAEALDAEVAAIVSTGQIVASVGYQEGSAPLADLESVASGVSRQLAVPGAGVCSAISARLAYPPDSSLIVARSGPNGWTPDESSLIHGMARVMSMSMRLLRLLDEERALREESQRQAATVARLLARLTERQTRIEWLADEQAALRRVATLVARGVPQGEIFAAVAEEVSRLAQADIVEMYRYDPDGTAVRVAVWGTGAEDVRIGERCAPGANNMITMVLTSGRPARIDDPAETTRSTLPRSRSVRSVTGSPVIVDGRLWGAVTATTTRLEPMPADAEHRIAGFTELVATAISNAQARAELAASRLRVVAAADEMRRRMERNLHDGTQQRLITLGLKLRGALDRVPVEMPEMRMQLAQLDEGVTSLLDELREISRGLHPAILSQAGLGSALKSLVRRGALPVTLDVNVPERLPEPIEVAAYYVVSEALTNATKHANASMAEVGLQLNTGTLRITVSDDGVGGADPSKGSGIVGLKDRVDALGGTMAILSPPGKGTEITVDLPLIEAGG